MYQININVNWFSLMELVGGGEIPPQLGYTSCLKAGNPCHWLKYAIVPRLTSAFSHLFAVLRMWSLVEDLCNENRLPPGRSIARPALTKDRSIPKKNVIAMKNKRTFPRQTCIALRSKWRIHNNNIKTATKGVWDLEHVGSYQITSVMFMWVKSNYLLFTWPKEARTHEKKPFCTNANMVMIS